MGTLRGLATRVCGAAAFCAWRTLAEYMRKTVGPVEGKASTRASRKTNGKRGPQGRTAGRLRLSRCGRGPRSLGRGTSRGVRARSGLLLWALSWKRGRPRGTLPSGRDRALAAGG